MNPAVLFSLILVSAPLGYLAWSVLSVDRKARTATVAILNRGHRAAEVQEKKSSGFIAAIGYRLTPPAYVRKLDRLLSLAGRPISMPLEKVLAAKIALGIAGASLGLYLAAIGTTPIMKLAGLFVLFLGYFIPDLLLYSKGQERQKVMQLELANTLDQMLIS
ncbi:MAG TPA: type II secretion system F family protein, partial [Arthrobacter sp.]|nr:type II secretion system F family protein [Arthrobacter sp.]